MAIAKSVFFDDLRTRIAAHQAEVAHHFQPLATAQLTWQPKPKEWSILHCLDHLSQTHVYYRRQIDLALTQPIAAQAGADSYAPSFWGRIYMAFAFNPRWSFPTPDAIAPSITPTQAALTVYLGKQEELLAVLDALEDIDLVKTLILVEGKINFNLGDVLKILVYHDALHLRQAQGVLAQMPATDRAQ